MGFALPARITAAAVRSYRTFSPLPAETYPAGGIVFCGTFRKTRFERAPPAVSRHAALWRPDFPPAGIEFPRPASDCPSGRPAFIIDWAVRKRNRQSRKPDVTVKHRQVAYLQSVGVFCQQRTFFKGVSRIESARVVSRFKAVQDRLAIDESSRVGSRVSAASKLASDVVDSGVIAAMLRGEVR